jgi:hypothetical protein
MLYLLPSPRKPKTRMNINGKAMVKTTEEGLFIIDLKAALVTARKAFSWE